MPHNRSSRVALAVSIFLVIAGAVPAADRGRVAFESIPSARFRFESVLGDRIRANEENWLLRAPLANPGIIEMFRLRDRQPEPRLVDWAGEFAGKYLISLVQALRMTENPELRGLAKEFVGSLLEAQAEDGYLGPFPMRERLLGHWDLWGHYHVILGLLGWSEFANDPAALAGARRIGDLICRTFLGTQKRVFDAGSHEMNMAIVHGLGELHRLTGEARYLEMAREVEKDWERAGDYLRTGLKGLEFFQTPRPRWESLHDLQGLLVLYRITGEERYRAAFDHHWRSILRFDRRNGGGFSSGEQATGNPYSPTAIETCCTIAWMALTLDELRLTGDARAADELELSLYNAACGAQHPSGRWWTYNTPMDGVREASAHTIVFQSRAGTPELNCCSVNAPRGLGILTEWTVMAAPDGLAINGFAPGRFQGRLPSGTGITIRWESDYPRAGRVRIAVEPSKPESFSIHLRIPNWSKMTGVVVGGSPAGGVRPGTYLKLDRRWETGDAIDVDLDMSLRSVSGDREAAGKVSLYRGPLLLAIDQKYNAFDEGDIPPIDLSRLERAEHREPRPAGGSLTKFLSPWVLVDVPAAEGKSLLLCDFASAGAAGTRYRSWLAAQNPPPAPVLTLEPRDGTILPPGAARFRWRRLRANPGPAGAAIEYRLEVSDAPEFERVLVSSAATKEDRIVLDAKTMESLPRLSWCYFRAGAAGPGGASAGTEPPARLRIDPSLPPASEPAPTAARAAGGVALRALLRGETRPEKGELRSAGSFSPSSGPNGAENSAVALDGDKEMLVYDLDGFPWENYTVSVWVNVRKLPEGRPGQVFSAWAAPMDDPLRIVAEGGKLHARIEAGAGHSTPGVPIETGKWHHIAAVKDEDRLILYVDGKERGAATAPFSIETAARNAAIGGNPNYSGKEFLAASFAGLEVVAKALSAAEVEARAKQRE